MCGRQQGIVNQIFGVPCKQCDKSENHKAPGTRRKRERKGEGEGEPTETETKGNAHADTRNALAVAIAMRQDASDACDY